jgi:acetoin utilization deacetylase AcuC-like enzyme
MLKIYHSDRFVPQLPEKHRFPISKYQLVREQLCYEGTVRPEQLEESDPIPAEVALVVHELPYWNGLPHAN